MSDITAAWTTNGNIRGLLMSISSVLLGSKLPDTILVRCDGQFPSFNEFYLEQLADLCRIKDVSFAFYVEKSRGIHLARESLMDNSPSNWIFMLDDDVVLEYNALWEIKGVAEQVEDFSFICGNKRDVNNRRGYKDFSLEPVDFEFKEDCSTHSSYRRVENRIVYTKVTAADSGCMLVNRLVVRRAQISFAPKDIAYNVGGEDSIFGLQCVQKGIKGLFCPNVVAWHLEKPMPNFESHDARCEIILRTAESMGLANGRDEMKATMPWCKPNRKEVDVREASIGPTP